MESAQEIFQVIFRLLEIFSMLIFMYLYLDLLYFFHPESRSPTNKSLFVEEGSDIYVFICYWEVYYIMTSLHQ